MARTVTNITSNVLSFIVSIVIPLFLTPFLIHKLGDSHYGLWILINSVIGYYSLLDLGISSSIIRYVSKYTANDERKNLNSFVNTVLLIFILVGIVAIVLSIALSLFLPGLVKADDSFLFSRLLLVLGFAFGLSIISRTFNGILRAIQRYDIANTIEISCSIANAGMVVFFLSRGGGLMALGLIALAIRFIDGSFGLFFALRKTPGLRINPRFARKRMLRTVFSYSTFAFIWGIADRLRFHMDSIVIGAFLSVGAITYYSIGARLMTYYVGVVAAFFSVTTPIFSSLEAQEQSKKIRSLLMRGTKFSSLIAIFVGTSLILYGKPFIHLWIGEEYDSSYNVMLILVFPYIIALSQNISISAAYGMGKHRFLSLVTVGEGVLNLTLSILLVRRYGIYGVALGTAIPMLIVKFFIQPIYICRNLEVPIKTYLAGGLLRQFIIGTFYFMMAKIATFALYPDSFIWLLVFVLIGSVLFAVLSVIFCLDKRERRIWREMIPSLKERIS